jgi:hypothetical protein
MSDLLKMYFFRLFKDKVFWICLGLGVGIAFLETIVYGIAVNMTKNSANDIGNVLVISTQSFSALSFTNLPALFGPAICFFFLTREFHDGTIRNMILSGKKRVDIYLSAVIVAFVICYLNVLVDEAFIWSFGSLFGLSSGLSDAAAVGRFLSSMGIFFVISLMYVSVAVSLCFLVPNAFGSFGIFIGFTLGLALLYSLISLVLPLLVTNNIMSSGAYQVIQESMTTYQTTYLEEYFIAPSIDATRFVWVSLWASGEAVIIGGSFLFFGGWRFNKSDLK